MSSFKLRNYQQELIDGLKKSLVNGHKNVLIQSAAGSGKTVTMAEIAKGATNKGNRVLTIVHRRELVEQIKNTFQKHGVDFDLCNVGMIQTVTRRLDRMKHYPQLILVDEAHHSLAKTYKRIFNHFEKAHVIGVTATPYRRSGKGLKEVYDDLIIGKSVQWLIENHNLAPFKYYSVNIIDSQKLKKSSWGDFTQKSIDEATGGIIYGDIIKSYEKFAKNKKTIVYAHNVEASKDVARTFSEAGYRAQSVDGKTPKDERKQAMRGFRAGEITVLVNAELYGEGVDIPDCEAVILLRPTDSLALHIQQSMRPMRYQPNKRAIIIDHVANYTRHGLPDTPHTWTLEDRKKAKQNKSDEPAISQCPYCHSVYYTKDAERGICPVCGQEQEVVERNNRLEHVDAEIQEIESFTTDYTLIRYKNKNKNELKTLDDWYLYAKAWGYKTGWIKYNFPRMRHMSWPQFYSQIQPIAAKYN